MRLIGTGGYLPERIVTADEVDAIAGLERGTIERVTHVSERRYAAEDESTIDMAEAAARDAFERTGVDPMSLDLIVSASAIPHQPIPVSAALLSERLGVSGMQAFDVNATCLSSLVALDLVATYLDSGRAGRALVVSAEKASVGINYDHAESAGLFGDGAAALLVEAGGSPHAYAFATFPEGAHDTEIRGGLTGVHPRFYSDLSRNLYAFEMDGPRVYRLAVRKIDGVLDRLPEGTLERADRIVPHQASPASLALMARHLSIPEEKLAVNATRYGNMVSASIPYTLHEEIDEGRIREGARVALLGTGAGLSIGALAFTF